MLSTISAGSVSARKARLGYVLLLLFVCFSCYPRVFHHAGDGMGGTSFLGTFGASGVIDLKVEAPSFEFAGTDPS